MPVLKQLRRDHANMARMLHVLQLKQKSLANGELPNFQLVREVIDYILDYQEGFTQPLEKVCTERLKQLDPSSVELTERLSHDYRALKARLRKLSDDLDMILMDAVVPMDRFAADLKSYLESHRAYLRDERELLFPLIRENFSDEDLDALAAVLPEGAQAQLERLQEAYPELYAELRDAPQPLT
ncbi:MULTISPECIES: hemerythrin domain-containing protein [Halomonas]|uniref:Hemerythrin-like domain-containing protein n=1 Tax=Halomonas ventosae TaxID=229007 RepID=A0A4R6HFW0_9GAMM|nr:hemerythrin domain-containing protein [Halomonas ventosae]TDO06856.1 hemerythrin-like domain-containing protein [Halomonas ventosae]